MPITDNIRLVIKVSKLYYEDNLSQKEISSLLDVSRPQISRLLNYARENNIVNIKINNPFTNESEAENSLIHQFNLKDALVVDVGENISDNSFMELGQAFARQIETYIPDNSVVGVMSGKTLGAVVKAINHIERRGLEFVPLIGGMGSEGTDWHANVIARSLAEKSGGRYSILNAPVIVKSPQARDMLVNEQEIANVLKKGEYCDIALIGIGQINERSSPYQAGVLTKDDINELLALGAVASVCTSYVNEHGEVVDNPITRRSIGQTLEKRRKCKIIAIAAGKSKVEAIKAVLSGGYIDVLITTLESAREIIK
ncbi:MAG: sugar-binding transcriptional regulator [Angelakisella sp.]|nr:sugar-binding transcriptional regulator [Angelakisella sp.]